MKTGHLQEGTDSLACNPTKQKHPSKGSRYEKYEFHC